MVPNSPGIKHTVSLDELKKIVRIARENEGKLIMSNYGSKIKMK